MPEFPPPRPTRRSPAAWLRAWKQTQNDLRATTERLEAANEGFRLAFDNAPTGVIVTDLNGRVLQANDTLAELMETRAASLENTNIEQYQERIDEHGAPAQIAAGLEALLRGEITVHKTTSEIRRRDGSLMYIVAHTSVARDEEGRPLSLVSHIEDITERHHTDEALREALQRQNEMLDRLMELDQMKSDFVATVSHDLRTPLTSIVGYVEMLLDGDVGEISDRQHHILETVQHGAAQLQRRIDDLLTFARIEAGTYEPERLELELGAVVGEALKTVQGQASHKGVDLHVDRAGDVRVVGDSHQLEQLVLNLAGNAVKFTPAGGHVDVVVRRDRSQAVLDVTDTGIGISPEDQPLVFERFFRSSDVRERQIQGTGLGLAIVRSIVDAHRGSISLESTVGEGTTFSVRLPA